MKTIKPLDELEMFDLLQAIYPERFAGEDDDTYHAALQFADEVQGFEDLADLLGRIVMLTSPMHSPLTGSYSHCLGNVEIANGQVHMTALVRRDADIPLQEAQP